MKKFLVDITPKLLNGTIAFFLENILLLPYLIFQIGISPNIYLIITLIISIISAFVFEELFFDTDIETGEWDKFVAPILFLLVGLMGLQLYFIYGNYAGMQ